MSRGSAASLAIVNALGRMLPALVVVLAIGLSSVVASAAPPLRVALVVDPDAGELTPRRLRAELGALGVEVVDVAPTGKTPSRESLEEAARSVGAFAAVRVAPSRGGVEVWIADRVTGKTVLREVVMQPHDRVDEIVALRVVELLRASLLELTLPDAPAGDVEPTPEVRRLVPPVAIPPAPKPMAEEPAVALALGPMLAFSTSGAPSLQLRLGARLRLSSSLGAHALMLLPTVPRTIDEAEGRADVSLALLGLGADASLIPDDPDWCLRGALTAALINFRVVGSAEAPLLAETESRWLAAGLARAELLYSLTPSVWVGVELAAGLSARRLVVRFDQREVGGWGAPFGGAGALFEFRIP